MARTAVSLLRMQAVDNPTDPRLAAPVGELSVTHPLFRRWWAARNVTHQEFGTKTVRHPELGELTFDWDGFQWAGDPDQQLCLGELNPLMRGEWGLVAGVVAAVPVHPVAECFFVHPEFSCGLSDRTRRSITNSTASSRNSGLNLRYFLVIRCITFRARSYWIVVGDNGGTSSAWDTRAI